MSAPAPTIPTLASESSPPSHFSFTRSLGWAVYLGVSWTWCIGMFLPALLVRDYGLYGFLVFALPNVLGAAAMGWVLRRAGAITILTQHRAAVLLFSVVTIAFQAWFLISAHAWFAPHSAQSHDSVLTAVTLPNLQHTLASVPLASLLFVLALILLAFRRTILFAAPAAWLASFCCIVVLFQGTDFPQSIASLRQDNSLFGSGPLLSLAPVCAFGFLLCPYLDATFLRARASTTDAESRLGFSLGFGVFFFAMILFTLGYSALLVADRPALATLTIITLHILGQLLFTIAVHTIELFRLARGRALLTILLTTAALALLARFAIPLAMPLTASLGVTIQPFEIIYRLFLSFYGLVFPAYVWLCMIPTRDGHHGPRRDKLLTLAAAIGLAAPFFYMGFIERQTAYLGPGLLIILLARLIVRALAKPPNPRTA